MEVQTQILVYTAKCEQIKALQQLFEDTKIVITQRKSKKDRQSNHQQKKDKYTNNDCLCFKHILFTTACEWD